MIALLTSAPVGGGTIAVGTLLRSMSAKQIPASATEVGSLQVPRKGTGGDDHGATPAAPSPPQMDATSRRGVTGRQPGRVDCVVAELRGGRD